MPERPPIPTDLRRRVLVEAGHRCAIHTCRHIDVDVHHIVPWERCREHTYDNLIALCPNCHRRADAGDIDRKALRIYKGRLSSSVIPPDGDEGVPHRDDAWRTRAVKENHSEQPSYDVEVELPSFFAADLDELNQIELGWALGCVQSFRRLVVAPIDWGISDAEGRDVPPHAGYLSATFAVTHFSESCVSLRYAVNEFGYGAMHSNWWYRTVTALRKPLTILRFEVLFAPGSDFVARISTYAVDSLLKSHETFDSDWVRRGAGPDPDNFRDFNVGDDGLLLTFPPYQVASWADGPQQVTVPWAVIRAVTNPRLVL